MRRPSPQTRCQGRSNCVACGLRQDMVCSDVKLEDLINFHTCISDFDYGPDTAIFTMGTAIEAVYCIRAGAVKLSRSGPDAGGRIVRVLKWGDVAGLESAFADRHEYTAVAVGEVRACRIPIADFRRFVSTHPGLQIRLIEKSQSALREAETWLTQLTGAAISARARMARLLLHLQMGDGGRIFRFRVADMAAIIGIAPETVSRVVAEFVRQGLLIKDGNSHASRHFRGDIGALARISAEG